MSVLVKEFNQTRSSQSTKTLWLIKSCFKYASFLFFAYCSDFNIKVVQVSNSSHKSLNGHEAPILSVALDPDEEFLVNN